MVSKNVFECKNVLLKPRVSAITTSGTRWPNICTLIWKLVRAVLLMSWDSIHVCRDAHSPKRRSSLSPLVVSDPPGLYNSQLSHRPSTLYSPSLLPPPARFTHFCFHNTPPVWRCFPCAGVRSAVRRPLFLVLWESPVGPEETRKFK